MVSVLLLSTGNVLSKLLRSKPRLNEANSVSLVSGELGKIVLEVSLNAMSMRNVDAKMTSRLFSLVLYAIMNDCMGMRR